MTSVNTARAQTAPATPATTGTNGTAKPSTDVAGTPQQCRALRDSTATDAYSACLRQFASAPAASGMLVALARGGAYGVNT